LIEAGFAWLPSLAWRLDRLWRRLRVETPHLKRLPSEYIRNHVWLTTQPMEEPQQREHVLDAIGLDRLGSAAVRDGLSALGTMTIPRRFCRSGSTTRSVASSSSTTHARACIVHDEVSRMTKLALVTGAASGLGRATALGLARRADAGWRWWISTL